LAKENKDYNPLDNEPVLPNEKPKALPKTPVAKSNPKDKKAKSTKDKDVKSTADKKANSTKNKDVKSKAATSSSDTTE